MPPSTLRRFATRMRMELELLLAREPWRQALAVASWGWLALLIRPFKRSRLLRRLGRPSGWGCLC